MGRCAQTRSGPIETSRARWKPIVILLTLATLMRCQGPSTGTGTSQGALSANLSSLSFASVQVGNSRTLSEALTNTGRSDVTISQDAISGAGFSVSGFSPPITLTPGQTYTFSVIFTPQSARSVSGSISFVSNASNSNLIIPLSGTGTAAGQLAVSPTSLNFGSVVTGKGFSLSASLSATGSSVIVNSANVSTSGFTLSGLSFPIAIAAGQSPSFLVTFTPESSGVANATLSFASNAINSPTVVALTGTGTIPLRTDVSFQGYPSPIPCPSSAGCAGGGALTGAGYYFMPSDFYTPMLRITDAGTYTSNSSRSFATDCGGSAEANLFDVTNTRFYVCDGGAAVHIFSLNTSTSPPQAAELYGTYSLANCGGGGGAGNAYFSFTQPTLLYSAAWNASNDPVICSYNVNSTSTGPTVANSGVSQIVDLATCVPALAGIGTSTYLGDMSVSGDDQTFAAYPSASNGQGSGTYVVIWNRTLGCRVWNTATGIVSGSYGSSPTGSVSIPDEFTVHNVRLSKSGTYVKIGIQNCTNNNCNSGLNQLYIWQINSLTVLPISTAAPEYGGGHQAIGYNYWVNGSGSPVSQNQRFAIRPANGTTPSFIPALYPSGSNPTDGHFSWNNDNSGDTLPFFAAFSDGANFAPTQAWNDEIDGFMPDGSVTWRFAHTYASNQSQNFSAQYAIGNVSQDGKFYLWTTDWDGMLGNIDGVTSTCTIGTNCRADVFMAILPIIQ